MRTRIVFTSADEGEVHNPAKTNWMPSSGVRLTSSCVARVSENFLVQLSSLTLTAIYMRDTVLGERSTSRHGRRSSSPGDHCRLELLLNLRLEACDIRDDDFVLRTGQIMNG